ncbi:hypothetical protein NEOLEDRAFT_1053084, partial [Neolentinus lepideus HHB14362 ss-1]
PFPLNPSFKPPAPLSDRLRKEIWEKYISDPVTNSARELSSHYGLSMKRVDAILRLKGLEAHWVKGKEVQTGFLAGMEKVLDVPDVPLTAETAGDPRRDVSEADALDEVEGEDVDREKYQRMFWEDVAEGQEPIVPIVLQQGKNDAASARKAAINAKSDPPHTFITHSGASESRPHIKFEDVGGKFLDVKDRTRRMKESERRVKMKERKRAGLREAIKAARVAV